jgi:hypothetical protein
MTPDVGALPVVRQACAVRGRRGSPGPAPAGVRRQKINPAQQPGFARRRVVATVDLIAPDLLGLAIQASVTSRCP